MSASPPSASGGKFDREAAYFGFDPVSFIDDVINCVEDYTCDGLDAIEKALVKLKSFKGKQALAGESVDKVLEKLSQSMNKNLDLFELYALRNFFSIPSAVQLPSSSDQPASPSKSQHTEEEEQALDQELRTLRRRLQQAKHVNRACKQEVATLAEELDNYQRLHDGATGKGVFEPGDEILPGAASALSSQSQALASEIKRLNEAVAASKLNLDDAPFFAPDLQAAFQRDQSVVPINTQQLNSFSQSLQ